MCKLLITLALWGWLIRLSYIAIVIGFRCCCTVVFLANVSFFLDAVSVFAAPGPQDRKAQRPKAQGTTRPKGPEETRPNVSRMVLR